MGPDQGFHRAPSTFQTKADAEGWLAAERRLIQNDEWSPAKPRRAKVRRATEAFGPYAEAWLEQHDIKPRTRALYRRQLDRFLLPAFGDMSLRDITPAVVRVWHSELDPKAPTQRAHVYGCFARSCRRRLPTRSSSRTRAGSGVRERRSARGRWSPLRLTSSRC
ncbi:N-terminal phage integrase SAM-like domain-containing protein [Dermacoccus abyssi]